MDGLQFETLPAARQDPMGVLESRYNQSEQYLRSQYDTELNSLQSQMASDKDFYNQLNSLNSKYASALNQERYKADQQVQSIRRVQALVDSGQIASDAGQEAIWRMVLPVEAERAMFQAAEQQKPYSIAQITSPAVTQSIIDFAEAAPATALFWTRKEKEPKIQQGLMNQYLQWRELIKYDMLNPIRQQQLDQQWDAYMASDERFDEWWLVKGKREPIAEIKAMRTPGRIGKIMRGQLMGAGGVTPIGRSIMKEKPRISISPGGAGFPVAPPPKKVPPPSAETLRRESTREAYEKGKRLGYWE